MRHKTPYTMFPDLSLGFPTMCFSPFSQEKLAIYVIDHEETISSFTCCHSYPHQESQEEGTHLGYSLFPCYCIKIGVCQDQARFSRASEKPVYAVPGERELMLPFPKRRPLTRESPPEKVHAVPHCVSTGTEPVDLPGETMGSRCSPLRRP